MLRATERAGCRVACTRLKKTHQKMPENADKARLPTDQSIDKETDTAGQRIAYMQLKTATQLNHSMQKSNEIVIRILDEDGTSERMTRAMTTDQTKKIKRLVHFEFHSYRTSWDRYFQGATYIDVRFLSRSYISGGNSLEEEIDYFPR